MTVLLQGVVGSTAYGLARAGSDIDRLGVFAAPTRSFLGLNPPTGKRATIVKHDPSDITLHEVGKYCTLALQCNPTILELLWLSGADYNFSAYEIVTKWGVRLVHLRRAFLSKDRVRDAYFGYAAQQFHRLANKHRFPEVPHQRIEKHARHLLRLLRQGLELYTTGHMTVRVNDPEEYFAFGRAAAEGDLSRVTFTLDYYDRLFANSISVLPEKPFRDSVEEYLIQTRRDLL